MKGTEMAQRSIREEELKIRVARDFFSHFDTTHIIQDIDFAVRIKDLDDDRPDGYLLWAEAKVKTTCYYSMLTQLILTLGKSRIFEDIYAPPFLGCFDTEKIVFIPYNKIAHIFSMSDFNWKIAPSDFKTREFQEVLSQVKKILEPCHDRKTYIFNFQLDKKELSSFIRENFKIDPSKMTKIKIDKNNFTSIYFKWLEEVKPSIGIIWELVKSSGILDADFYLADMLSRKNKTLTQKLYVILKNNYYELDRVPNIDGLIASKRAIFKDGQEAHHNFWTRYERPPLTEYWDYIIDRRDLLVPQDVRERKGSYYTPKIWVELSQRYLAEVLGHEWQEEYYVWDCAAGTGNLQAGLINKHNIWVSTLDQADVDVMKERICNGANLLEKHVFKFDFLNDKFSKLPDGLKDIIFDGEKRKKLVIYINPPYAEAASKETLAGTGRNKIDVAVQTKIYEDYFDKLGIAGRELFAQFLILIYEKMPGAKIAHFSKLKVLQAPSFRVFRKNFQPELKKMFVVPANTFDNVKGDFPIGFFIWDTEKKKKFDQIRADVYNERGKLIKKKIYSSYDDRLTINDWLIKTRNRPPETRIGFMSVYGADFQHNNNVFIIKDKYELPHPRGTWITDKNIIEVGVYYAVRKIICPDWLNDRDQFLHPTADWQSDQEFIGNCLTYMLFSNNLKVEDGINHFLPFTEKQVGAQDKFASSFMTDFFTGKIKMKNMKMFDGPLCIGKFNFSDDAEAVFEAGRKLWTYYHKQPRAWVNASLYDIRTYFQGRNEQGRVNAKSVDEKYNVLMRDLRLVLFRLARRIMPKIYEYRFLLK